MPSRILIGFGVVIFIMLAIPVLLAWSNSRRRLRLRREGTGGAVVLRMPRGHHAILATIAILPFGSISVAAFSAPWSSGADSGRWILGGLMALAGAVLGGYLLALEARAHIRVDEFSIEKVGAVTRRRSAWHNVAKLTYNPMNHWFFLTLTNGARLYVTEGLDGIADFAELALRRLPQPVLDAAPDAVEELRELAAS
jgi:hypothetical protein